MVVSPSTALFGCCAPSSAWRGVAVSHASVDTHSLSGTPSTASAFQGTRRTRLCGAFVCFGSTGVACLAPFLCTSSLAFCPEGGRKLVCFRSFGRGGECAGAVGLPRQLVLKPHEGTSSWFSTTQPWARMPSVPSFSRPPSGTACCALVEWFGEVQHCPPYHWRPAEL